MAKLRAGPEQAGNKGRFRPGQSGNPSGRPKGARNRTTARCVELLGHHSDAVMAKVIAMAKEGDGVALKLCVDRLLPARAARDRVVDVDLPDIAAVTDLVQAAAAVIDHAAHGRITLSEAKEFMALLEVQRKLVETQQLAVRLEVLEGRALAGSVESEIARVAPDLRSRIRLVDGGGER